MDVGVHESWGDELPGTIDDSGACRNFHQSPRADGGNAFVHHDDGGLCHGWPAVPIDHGGPHDRDHLSRVGGGRDKNQQHRKQDGGRDS